MSSSRLAQEQLHDPLSMIYPAIGPPSFPSRPGSFVQIDCCLEVSLTETLARGETRKWSTDAGRHRLTIDILPDVALLEIFDCYVNQAREEEEEEEDPFKIQAWHTLVHVCRKWRIIALGSPLRLDLRLFCTDTTPVKETLAVWPPLPIVIGRYDESTQMDNIIVALEHNDRVCQINLVDITNSQMEEVLAAMQQPFPALTKLRISWAYWQKDETRPVVPESLLGGSAPRLQHLELHGVRFPGLPKLVLSATDLVSLSISNIPHSIYFSPEAIVRCLSTLMRLERLELEFESPLSRPIRESRRLHPLTRSALPALTHIGFKGVSEYLEDLVARIDAPLLHRLYITFFHQLIFDTPQLAQFLGRTPNIQPSVEAHIGFSGRYVEVASSRTFPRKVVLGIRCRQPDWQLSCLTQVCSSSFPEAFIPTVEHLYICEGFGQPRWQDDIEDSQWLEVLHPFTAVKCLYLSQAFASRIAPALQELAGEVLPSLQNLFLEDLHTSGHADEAIGKFVAARRLAGHPIVFSNWDR
ncbi:hypothetical protein F5888DRAFT_1878580 [Russula emetica]|nr:hypothetical protein F5888DRAFT_1878580 [Russula emetica]